MALTMGSTGLR